MPGNHSHTTSEAVPTTSGHCPECGTTDFMRFVSCKAKRCEFVLDRPITVPVSDDEVTRG